MLSKTSLGIAAAGAGLCFLGYCIYFDKKRRNDPDFKQKLREKRKKSDNPRSIISNRTEFPDMTNTDAKQKFFLQEAQLGEELLITGDIEAGIEHLSNAVIISGNPQELLQALRHNFPPEVYTLLVQALPAASQRLSQSMSSTEYSSPIVSEMIEDDVE